MEQAHNAKINQYKEALEKLGEKYTAAYDVDKVIKKLQRQLKYLNNNKINQKTKGNWSLEKENLYEKNAAKLIDSIIKLRKNYQ